MNIDDVPVGGVVEGGYSILPRDILRMDRPHTFIGLFGWGELEHLARAYVLRCQTSNRWESLSEGEFLQLCGEYLLPGYHYFDDDHSEGDVQPFAPTELGAGTFFLLDRGLMFRGGDGRYRVTERFINTCALRR